ncbi:hypothetical protein CU098_000907, partial [Rhizopus stolonifer]
MPTIKKQRNYRKKQVDSDDESTVAVESPKEVSATIEELNELRKLRRKPVGLDAEKLLKGIKRKKKKATVDPNAWSLKAGGLIDPDSYRAKLDDDESASTAKKLKLDAF